MSKQCLTDSNEGGVLLSGYYKKLKTMKKKFFVLCDDSCSNEARIEYYDNEKKYKSGFTPKRIIKIRNCFNINRRLHTKYDFVITLASMDGGFGIIMDSEDEMNTWLNHLLHLQKSGKELFDFPQYDYVWQVIIQKKGIAEQQNIFGTHHICLTNKSVTFIKTGREKNVEERGKNKVEVLLTAIRRCGDSQCYFYMEMGRQSSLGSGELWMETEDSLTAQNMHRMILSKMTSLNEGLIEPMRKRSSSATETTNLHHDRKLCKNFDTTNTYISNPQNLGRNRCDSLPTRSRASSECRNRIVQTIPTTSAIRVLNLHGSNTSPIVYSASEESDTADFEECAKTPSIINSKSPEDMIPEENINSASDCQTIKNNPDINYGTNCLMKASINLYGASKSSDKNQDISGVINNQLNITMQVCSLKCKCENDLSKDSTVNRVRAFSVGSRIKSSYLCLTPSAKLFNSNSVDSSSGKSTSVPTLNNKNLQSVDKMGDLMEIDFSRSVGRTLNRNFNHIEDVCQSTPKMAQKDVNVSNLEQATQKSENGYLEMKPIALVDNTVDKAKLVDKRGNFSPADSNVKHFQASEKESKLKFVSSSSIYIPTCDTSHSEESNSQQDALGINKNLYYATLDFTKCGNEVNNRYGFQESVSETDIDVIRSEYAKINFVQPDTSQCLSMEKN